MAIIFDTIDQLECSENEFGVVDSLRRRFIGTGGLSNDAQILWEALVAPGIPRAGDMAPGNSNLECMGRQVRVLSNSPSKVEIICQYAPIGSNNTRFIFSGGTSLTQNRTQVDRFGNQIAVGHTWPEDDPDYPSKTQYQPIDLSVLTPQSTMVATGSLLVAYPDYVSRLWTGSMNAAAWAGAGPYEWLCSRVDWEPLQVGFGLPRRWMFRFEFQHDFTTWVPQVFFEDARTNKPAANLVPGFGAKYIDWYGLLDYNVLFPVR